MDAIIAQTLKANRLFSHLTDEETVEVADRFELEEHGRDEYIFLENDPAEKLYLAASGRVKIVKHTPEGKDVILEIISPPEIFGGVAALDGRPYPASAQAMETARVVSIERTAYFGLLETYHVLALEASIYFGERLRNAYDMLRNISVERVERRIASLLVRFGDRVGRREGDRVVMEMGLTMQEIAEMVGTTVETTIRTMNKFKKEGLISYGKGKTVLFPGLKDKLPG
jgi:CRP/FNR family transcriptional regulator